MPDQTPAQELRTAARTLRHAAQRATHQQGGQWMRGTAANRSDVVLDHPHEPTVLIETFAERLEAVNVYLTLVGPATGEAVADWLDAVATEHPHDVIPALPSCGPDCDGHEAFVLCQRCGRVGVCAPIQPALVVASAILGQVTQ